MGTLVLILLVVAISFAIAWSKLRDRHAATVQQYSQLAQQFQALQTNVNQRAQGMYDKWRTDAMAKDTDDQAKLLFEAWKLEEDAVIRKDAITRSKAVMLGQVTEHLFPYMEEFPYNPKDARFLGSPIDLIIFDGLTDGHVKQIVFMEVKTGKSQLSTRERQVRRCIEGMKFGYKLWQRPTLKLPEALEMNGNSN